MEHEPSSDVRSDRESERGGRCHARAIVGELHATACGTVRGRAVAVRREDDEIFRRDY